MSNHESPAKCPHCGVQQFNNPDADPALAAMAYLCWKCVKPVRPAAGAAETALAAALAK